MLPAGLWFLIFFSQIKSILVKQNGNNKRIECFSNDSTVFISVFFHFCHARAKNSILSITGISLSKYICGAF